MKIHDLLFEAEARLGSLERRLEASVKLTLVRMLVPSLTHQLLLAARLPFFLTHRNAAFLVVGFYKSYRSPSNWEKLRVEIGCLVWPLGAFPNMSSPFEWILFVKKNTKKKTRKQNKK